MTNYEKARAWRGGLQVGQQVLIIEKGSKSRRVVTVKRLTATQIIVDDRERRFNKKSGVEVGCEYSPRIEPVTPEAVAGIQAAAKRSEFARLTLRTENLTDEEIAVMLEALRDYRQTRACS